jgi:hypothetical protein
MKKLLIISLALVAGVISCQKPDEDVADMGYDYFPLESGQYIIYDVVETTYDDFLDTVYVNEYILKELVDSVMIDGEGRKVYQLKRFINSGSDSVIVWTISDVWTAYRGQDRAERTEENVTYVKLVFPLRRSKTWDGNARNSLGEQKYKVLDYELKAQIGAAIFGRTARINHLSNKNLIEEQLSEEVYARGIGLVLKVQRDVKINPADSTINSGFEHRWTYLEHGKE